MELTFEELKAEAKRQGYGLIRRKEFVKLLPCKCGSKLREHWSTYNSSGDRVEKLTCKNCGLTAVGKTELAVKDEWNRMVSE